MKRKITVFVIVVLVMIIFSITNQSQFVSADNRTRPTYKFSQEYNTIFTLWGRTGNNYYAIRDNQQYEGAGTFSLEAIMIAWGNITVEVEVYSFYEEKIETVAIQDENSTEIEYVEVLKVNSTLLERNSFSAETTYTQRWIEIELEIGEYEEQVSVKVIVGEKSFFYKFTWKWDFIDVIRNNIEWFMLNIVFILVPVFILFVIAVILAKVFLRKVYSVPRMDESPLVPMLVYGLAVGLVVIGFIIRPPSFYLIVAGSVLAFFMIALSVGSVPTNLVCFHDQISGNNFLVDVVKKDGKICYVRSSWVDVFYRLCGRELVMDIEGYMLPEKGDYDYLVQGENIRLPEVSFSLGDKMLYRFGVVLGVLIIIVGCFVLLDVTNNSLVMWFLLLVPMLILIYLVMFRKFEVKQLQIDFYSKTSQDYFAKSTAENLTQQSIRLDIKQTSEELMKLNKQSLEIIEKEPYLYRLPKRSKLRGCISKIPVIRCFIKKDVDQNIIELINLRKVLLEDLEISEQNLAKLVERLRFVQDNPYDLQHELKILAEAGADVEKTRDDNHRLRQLCILGTSLREIKNILLLEQIAFPLNFQEKAMEEKLNAVKEKIKTVKDKASSVEVDNLSPTAKTVIQGKSSPTGGVAV